MQTGDRNRSYWFASVPWLWFESPPSTRPPLAALLQVPLRVGCGYRRFQSACSLPLRQPDACDEALRPRLPGPRRSKSRLSPATGAPGTLLLRESGRRDEVSPYKLENRAENSV